MTTHSHLRVAAIAVLAAAAIAAAGCGSSSKDDTASFNKDYAAQSANLKAIGDDIGTTVTGADKLTDAQVATQFSALAKRAHDAAAAILDLHAPEASKADVAALSTAVEKAGKDLDDIVTAAKQGDPQAAKTATEALVADSVPVKATREKLDTATK